MGFNVNSIQRGIQPLNPQIGFIVNSIQRQIQTLKIKPSNRIQCQLHSKTDSTLKLRTDSTIKPISRIQCEFHS